MTKKPLSWYRRRIVRSFPTVNNQHLSNFEVMTSNFLMPRQTAVLVRGYARIPPSVSHTHTHTHSKARPVFVYIFLPLSPQLSRLSFLFRFASFTVNSGVPFLFPLVLFGLAFKLLSCSLFGVSKCRVCEFGWFFIWGCGFVNWVSSNCVKVWKFWCFEVLGFVLGYVPAGLHFIFLL